VVVDDDPGVLEAFEQLLLESGHHLELMANGNEALRSCESAAPDLVITDLCMPGINGLELVRALRARWPRLPVILMTGHGTMETAIEATKLGAFDYYLKPFDPQSMLDAVDRSLECGRLMGRHVELNPRDAADNRDAIIGASRPMQEVFKAIGRVAATNATVLIRGESGTGKELVGRAIYQHSNRASAPLLTINCAAIPETLLESELFGYERGAFTGAATRKIGKFEQADGGTLFLDEIGDVSPAFQAKLLRVLQERRWQRVGGTETIGADVRIITATNRPLEQAIKAGQFREDLLYRLNVVSIVLPPLRDRPEDIAPLAVYLLARFARELGIAPPTLTDEAIEVLAREPWPGNVRQLENCLYRALVFAGGHPLTHADIERHLDRDPAKPHESAGFSRAAVRQLARDYLGGYGGARAYEDFQRLVDLELLAEALERTRGNHTHAAKLLGISRPTLYAKLRPAKMAQ
jgi:DNA-binding NtrC family response regulator